MTLPLTGSYYGFANTGFRGRLAAQLQAARAALWHVQRRQGVGEKFVHEHGVKLHSANVVAQHSISAARGEKDDMGQSQGRSGEPSRKDGARHGGGSVVVAIRLQRQVMIGQGRMRSASR